MTRFYFFLFSCLLISFSVKSQISEPSLRKHIDYLASDKLKGREIGKRGNNLVAKYIAKEFKKYGLTPKGEKGFYQFFVSKIRNKSLKDSLRKTQNIIGFLDNNASKTIVIGAHYDHLGLGNIGGTKDSLNIGKIHNGADDNASGVAGLLELAKFFSQNNHQEKMNLLFIAFGAEEMGLIGSKYFVNHPTIPLTEVHWMLNMDMIGRYNAENGVAIIGYGTSAVFAELFKNQTSSIKFYTSNDGRGGSDQTSFYDKEIPVLFFHTGGHEDYHKTTDDSEKIDYKSLKAIIELEREIIQKSMEHPIMKFIKTN